MSVSEKYIELGDRYFLHTYNRAPLVLEKGEGVYLYDAEGKRYLDFASGIGVFALGYGNREYNDALKNQIDLLVHTSNLYYNEPSCTAAKSICGISGMDRVFFTNSGAEAIEGAVKSARKYAFTCDGTTDHEIIAMENSFHGRTMGALSVTGNAHYREPFEPGIGNIRFARFNDLESVSSLVNSRTCAVICETLQGEGGVHPASDEFMKGLRALCSENNILLILDEVQCGMGRTGNMFAFQRYGIEPDILVLAKALGCGVPVGAFLMKQYVADKSLVPGDHGSTYGGNPFATAALNEVLRQFESRGIVDHVKNMTPYFTERLSSLDDLNIVKERRGLGFMQAIELNAGVSGIIEAARNEGLIVISAGANVLRLLPPLILEKEHIDEGVDILNKVLRT